MASKNVLSLLLAGWAAASVVVRDPADVIDPADWESDNALIADYKVAFHSSQPSDIEGKYVFTENTTTLIHEHLAVDANDTSVVLVSDGASLEVSYSTIEKLGYYSNLNDASFWGFNAAVNVANGSSASFDHVNVTVHNGAANIYSYGTGTVVKATNTWLYSSGPLSHGFYASGNGTVFADRVTAYSGGMRSSIFSGDAPAGYVYVSRSVAHTAGVGSACFYALGLIDATNVACETEQAPTLFMDGHQNATLVGVTARAGLLASTVMFSSAVRTSGGLLQLIDSSLESLGDEMPGLWFGNTIATAIISNSEIVTKSGILVIANMSQVTQEFSFFAGTEENSSMLPAVVDISVSESSLEGDLVAYSGSEISWTLGNYSSWVGTAYPGNDDAIFNIVLDSSSTWNLTADIVVQTFTNLDSSLANVYSAGFTLNYNSSAEGNSWLGGSTLSLNGGGQLVPY